MDIQNPFLKKHLNKILLLFLILFIAFLFNIHKIKRSIRWATMTTQERIEDTSTVSPTNLSNAVDTAEITQTNSLIMEGLELAWGADRVNIQQAMNRFAGVSGSMHWEFDISPKDYKDNPDIFIADGYAVNTDIPGKKKTLELSVLVNSRTKNFKILKAKENGKALEGPIIIMTLAVEGGYSTSTTN
jgi:hypothetical protein